MKRKDRSLDEYCTDCKEYDKEKHCCPRWNKVIKETMNEIKSAAYKHGHSKGVKKGIEIGLREAMKRKWTPCYDPSKLPKNMPLWATFDDGDGYRYVDKIFYDMTEWNRDVSNVVAYMEYEEPKPYGGK